MLRGYYAPEGPLIPDVHSQGAGIDTAYTHKAMLFSEFFKTTFCLPIGKDAGFLFKYQARDPYPFGLIEFRRYAVVPY